MTYFKVLKKQAGNCSHEIIIFLLSYSTVFIHQELLALPKEEME